MPKSDKKHQTTKTVPYVKGFRRPSVKSSLKACEDGDNLPKEFLPHTSFKPIPKCICEDDWLAQYCEEVCRS